MGIKVNGQKAELLSLPNLAGIPVLRHNTFGTLLGHNGYGYTDYARTNFSYDAIAYVGLVCSVSSHYDRVSERSYYTAQVWDMAQGKAVCVAAGCDYSEAEVDATPEVKAAYDAWKKADDERQAREEAERSRQEAIEAAAREERRVVRGKMVVVARGRKVPKGTEGEVFWIGNNGYGESVGLVLADGSKVFTALKNVDVKLDAEGKAVVAVKRPVEKKPIPVGLVRGSVVSVKGEQGEVFWIGEAKNGSGLRVGVNFGNGYKEFYSAGQVSVVRAA